MSVHSRATPARCQFGLTLIELLIALVMGLVLLAGVVTVFVANKQTYRHQDALARLQENGRFAVSRLERDIRRAAATFGCVPSNPQNTLRPPPGTTGTCPSNKLTPIQGEPIYGLDNISGVSIGGKTVKSGTDVLAILLGVGGSCRILDDVRPSAQMKVESTCSHLKDDDIVMVVSDLAACENGAVFQITNTNARITGNNHHVEVVHDPGVGVSEPGNCTKDIGPEFTDGYMIKIAYMQYFIADTGRGVPGLFVYDASGRLGSPQELVEGVEDMQLLYGVDTDNDNSRTVDDYYTAKQVEAVGSDYWSRVRSVRFNLLLQSVDANALAVANPVTTAATVDTATGPWNLTFSDRRWRQVYSATTGVRGRLP